MQSRAGLLICYYKSNSELWPCIIVDYCEMGIFTALKGEMKQEIKNLR